MEMTMKSFAVSWGKGKCKATATLTGANAPASLRGDGVKLAIQKVWVWQNGAFVCAESSPRVSIAADGTLSLRLGWEWPTILHAQTTGRMAEAAALEKEIAARLELLRSLFLSGRSLGITLEVQMMLPPPPKEPPNPKTKESP